MYTDRKYFKMTAKSGFPFSLYNGELWILCWLDVFGIGLHTARLWKTDNKAVEDRILVMYYGYRSSQKGCQCQCAIGLILVSEEVQGVPFLLPHSRVSSFYHIEVLIIMASTGFINFLDHSVILHHNSSIIIIPWIAHSGENVVIIYFGDVVLQYS